MLPSLTGQLTREVPVAPEASLARMRKQVSDLVARRR
jgi:hypothetical protein